MPQQDYGAMQSVANFFGKGKKEEKAPPKKEDTSYHDAMVKRANDSFKIANTSPTQGKSVQKPKTRKRVTTKR